MAKSISEAQAQALATGFLDTLGEDFKPTKSLSKFFLVVGKLLSEAQDNLNSADRVATGALSSSITATDPIIEGKNIRVDISMLYYWKFINDGVKGVKSGSPSSKYSFKNLYVGKKMLKAFTKWVTKEGIKAKAKGQGKPISKRERKRKSMASVSANSKTSVAYAIARSVKAKGLKKTNFFTKALKEANKYSKQELGKALAVDILEALPKTI